MDWIKDIGKIKKSGGSAQFEESEIINFIFQNIGTTNKYLVDLGAGAYDGSMSNVRDLMRSGWSGFGVDCNPMADKWAIKLFITPSNVVPLFFNMGVPLSFDFLNLDIDSCDFWVLKNILEAGYRPRLVCSEFNGTLDPNKPLVLSYEEDYMWDGTNKYGYSFEAGKRLLERHGYSIIFNQHNTNIFAIYTGEASNYGVKAEKTMYHPENKKAVWEEYK